MEGNSYLHRGKELKVIGISLGNCWWNLGITGRAALRLIYYSQNNIGSVLY